MDEITFSQGVANLPNDHPVAEWWSAHWHTQVIEMPVYAVLLWWAFRRWWAVIPLSLVVNIVTHPTLWYLVPFWHMDGAWLEPLLPHSHLSRSSFYCWLIMAECGVFIVEGHMVGASLVLWGREKYRGAPFAITYGLFVALLANIPSTLAGLLAS